MKSKYFESVQQGNTIGDGTVGAMIKWLKVLIDVLFPDNSIEYWHENGSPYSGQFDLKPEDMVPPAGSDQDHVHHVACYVRPGNCEGEIIEVSIQLRSGIMKSMAFIKSFGSVDVCWDIARCISEALNSILFWQEIPEIVAMTEKLPKKHSWDRRTSLTELVSVCHTPVSLTVISRCGTVFENRSWTELGSNAKFAVAARLKDWSKVLTSMEAAFEVKAERRYVLPDLPGYLFSDRGAEGCTGIYLLPPDGNLADDRTWLGYFKDDEEAIRAAQVHQDGRSRSAN